MSTAIPMRFVSNRSMMQLIYKQPFLDWLRSVDPHPIVKVRIRTDPATNSHDHPATLRITKLPGRALQSCHLFAFKSCHLPT